MKYARLILKIAALLLIGFVLYVNARLYDLPVCDPAEGGALNVDVVKQLQFLKRQLHEGGAAEAMQQQYPEGFVFSHALYALAWCDVTAVCRPESVRRQEGLREIAFSMDALDAPAGKQVFSRELPLPYGAFYRGWTSYVRGKYLSLLPVDSRDTLVVQRFKADCREIAAAIIAHKQPYLESYADAAWPADNILCLAALSLHDRLFEPAFQELRKVWLERIRSALVAPNQMIPHAFDVQQNAPDGGVRGSSQSLMLCFLPEIDSAFSEAQYQRFRSQFVGYQLGMPGVREYPKGDFGLGDIDSGPVLFGMGGAASVVGIRAAAQHRDWELAMPLYAGVNALLMPTTNGQEKKYLLGTLPVLDAFMAWGSVGLCGCKDSALADWRWKCQVISLMIIGALGWGIRPFTNAGKA
jgi:hypothetical protein